MIKRNLYLCFVGLLLTSQAFAHAMLENSVPANKSVLFMAPKAIELQFGHITKLTKLTLVYSGQEIPLNIDLSATPSKSFSIPLPSLRSGNYQVKWSSLASDGHAMTGNFTFSFDKH